MSTKLEDSLKISSHFSSCLKKSVVFPLIFVNTFGHLIREILLNEGGYEKLNHETGGVIMSRSVYDHKFYWNDFVKNLVTKPMKKTLS